MSKRKYSLKSAHRSDGLIQNINNDLRFLIQFLDERYNDFWLLPVPKTTLYNQCNDMKMAAEVKLASALNRHQGRQLCCVKKNDLVFD